MSLIDLLLNKRFNPDLVGTPGINPNAPDPRLPNGGIGGFGAGAGAGMGAGGPFGIPLPPNPNVNPATQERKQKDQQTLLSPILSRLGPIGRGADSFLGDLSGAARSAAMSGSLAALAPRTTQGLMQGAENQRADSMAELQKRLIEARIGLTQAQTDRETDPRSNLRTQSTRTLANGNIGIVTNDPNNPVIDTGVKEAGKSQLINVPGLGLLRHNPVDNSVTQVAPEDIIRQGQAERKGAEQAASTAAQKSTEQQFQIPARLQSAESQVRKIDSAIEEAARGMGLVSETTTGLIGDFLKKFPSTDARSLSNVLKTLKANLSFDTLTEMRKASPSGGALGSVSERELDLLGSALTALDQAEGAGDVKRALTKVLTHYGNWRSVISREMESLESQQQDNVSGFRIVDAGK